MLVRVWLGVIMRAIFYLILSTLLTAVSMAASRPAAPTVSAIRVQMFENKTGRLSSDVLAGPNPGLWNSIAGVDSSNAALVIIEVSGEPSAVYSGRLGALPSYFVRLRAVERGLSRPLLDQRVALPPMGTDGMTRMPFLIYPGGCTAIELSASLIGPDVGPPMRATLPMACGE